MTNYGIQEGHRIAQSWASYQLIAGPLAARAVDPIGTTTDHTLQPLRFYQRTGLGMIRFLARFWLAALGCKHEKTRREWPAVAPQSIPLLDWVDAGFSQQPVEIANPPAAQFFKIISHSAVPEV